MNDQDVAFWGKVKQYSDKFEGRLDMKHTPGPWAVHITDWKDKDGNDVRPIITTEDKLVGKRLIALVRVSSPRKNDGMSNARLIAAAPEMYEICKAILDEHEDGLARDAWIYDKAEQVISKIEGQEMEG